LKDNGKAFAPMRSNPEHATDPLSAAESNRPLEGTGASGGDAPQAPEERQPAGLTSRESLALAMFADAMESAIQTFAAYIELQVYRRPGTRGG